MDCELHRGFRRAAVISTGLISLDIALGIGGVPRGGITEVFGAEATGKTSLCLSLIAQAQRDGEICAFVDAERSLDPLYAKRYGVDINALWLSQPTTGEEALDIVSRLARSGAVALTVVDSAAALTSQAELSTPLENASASHEGPMLARALHKIEALLRQTGMALVFTNHLGEQAAPHFGVPSATPGGLALKAQAVLRVALSMAGSLDGGETASGYAVQARVVKNKFAPPFSTTVFNIMYNGGIDILNDLLMAGLRFGLIDKRGASYVFGEHMLGLGQQEAVSALRRSPAWAESLTRQIRQLALPASPVPVEEE